MVYHTSSISICSYDGGYFFPVTFSIMAANIAMLAGLILLMQTGDSPNFTEDNYYVANESRKGLVMFYFMTLVIGIGGCYYILPEQIFPENS